MKTKKQRGRPQGAKNIKQVVDVEPSRCKCGSSERTQYTNTRRKEFANAGTPFIAIIYRTCECLSCGQTRIDREPVYAGKKENNQNPVITC